MQQLTLQQTADYLESAIVTDTHDYGHTIVHHGINAAGAGFVLVNDHKGQSAVSEA